MSKKDIFWKTYFTKGRKEFDKGDYKESIKAFTNGIKKTTRYKSLIFLCRAKSYFELGEYKKAFYDFKKTLDKDFEFDDGCISEMNSLYILISQYYFVLDLADKKFVIDCLETFSELILKEKEFNLKPTSNKQNKRLSNKEDYLFELYWCKALLHEKCKNLVEALFDLEKAITYIKEGDCHDWILADKARINLLKGNYSLAIKDLNSSIRIANIKFELEDSYRSYICASLIYEFFQDFNMAESMINMAIEKIKEAGLVNVFPGEISFAYIKRAYIKMTKGNIENILNDFGIAIENDNDWFIRNRKTIEKIPVSIKNLIRVKHQISFN